MLQDFRKLGLFSAFVAPALFLFLIPAVALGVMYWGQRHYDNIYLESYRERVESDAQLTQEQKNQIVDSFRQNPVSNLLKSNDPEVVRFLSSMPEEIRKYYKSFDIFIKIAWLCILSGVGLICLVVLSVPLSLRSQRFQYLALATGWHSIRFFMTLQVIGQGILVMGLSFWVTALLFRIYSVKLIGAAVLVSLGAMFAVLRSVFLRIPSEFELSGKVLEKEAQPEFWNAIANRCRTVGTPMPDQIVVGIDDRFFVTEHPVTVGGVEFQGKTLYLSLSMLKTFTEKEFDAVLMHEMAHFSGNDTYYSRKIGPLLNKFHQYLVTLYENEIARPIFYCTLMFRNLYEISLGKLSRQREFRADGIAAEAVGAQALGNALVRLVAYSSYRGEIEHELIGSRDVLDKVDVRTRLEDGFHGFSRKFSDRGPIGESQSSHPFDSHPPMAQRFEALGLVYSPDTVRNLLDQPGDGKWYSTIRSAESIESELWSEYESRFRRTHENLLAYRYIPETPEEAAIVAASFPPMTLPAAKGSTFSIDYEKIRHDSWPEPIRIGDIHQIGSQNSWGTPELLLYDSSGIILGRLPMARKSASQQNAIAIIQSYCGRYHIARSHKEAETNQSKEVNGNSESDS